MNYPPILKQDLKALEIRDDAVEIAEKGLIAYHINSTLPNDDHAKIPELSSEISAQRGVFRQLSGFLIHTSNSKTASTHWQQFVRGKRRRQLQTPEQALTPRNKELFDVPLPVIEAIWEQVVKTLRNELYPNQVRKRLEARISSLNNGFITNDNRQKSLDYIMGLENLLTQGICFTVPPEFLSMIQKASVDNEIITDALKSSKILTSGDLGNTKVSIGFHDLFDHLWLFNELKENKIFDKYSKFLENLGNPQNRNIFGRESELIASIGYDYRAFKEDQKPQYFELSLPNIVKLAE